MYKLCKTEQSAQRQRQLELGLLEVMMTERYEDITISDLCDRMRIPRKSFYRYFSGKDGALQALLDHTFLEYERLSDFTTFADRNTVQKELVIFFEHWKQHRRLLDALQRSRLSGMLVERAVANSLSQYQNRMLSETAHVREIHTHAISFVTCGLMSMVLNWHKDSYRVSTSEMAATAAHLLTQPLVPEKKVL